MYRRQSRLGRKQARNLEGPLGDIRAYGTVFLVWLAGIAAGVVLIIFVANHNWFSTNDPLKSSKTGDPIPVAAATSLAGKAEQQANAQPSAAPAGGGQQGGGAAPSGGGDVQAGLAAFGAKGCSACHANNGLAAGIGPKLVGTGAKGDQYITTRVRQGKGTMPAFSTDKVSDKDLADLIAYIKSLK